MSQLVPRGAPAAAGVLPRRRRRPLVRGSVTVLLGGLLVAAGLGLAPAASAHSELVSASPADGSTVSTPPKHVVLTFNEDVGTVGDAIIVTSPSGARVDTGATKVDGAKVSVALKPVTEPGTYTVAYRVVSDDGHPVTAQLTFSFQSPSTTTAPASSVASPGASDPSSSGGNATPWIVVAALAVIVVVAAWLLMRRRRA